jgi:hypothetical protein
VGFLRHQDSWPLPRPATLVIAISYSFTPTGVSPSIPAHSNALRLGKQDTIRYNALHLYYVTIIDSVWFENMRRAIECIKADRTFH